MINSWKTSSFKKIFKDEVERLEARSLPLQAGLSQGSYVSDTKFTAMLIGATENSEFIIVRAGVFYTSIIAGCNCADDPSPVDEQTEYCEVQLDISKETAEAKVRIVS